MMTPTRILTVNDSSNISVVQYNHVDKSMIIDFTSGARYIYFNVKPELFGSLCASESIGTLFNRWINNIDVKYERIK